VAKEGKIPQVIWDGSTKQTNGHRHERDNHDGQCEAKITFEFFKPLFYQYLHNMRASYPLADSCWQQQVPKRAFDTQ